MTAFFNFRVCLSLSSPGFPGLNEQNLFSGQPNVHLFLHLLAYHLSSSLTILLPCSQSPSPTQPSTHSLHHTLANSLLSVSSPFNRVPHTVRLPLHSPNLLPICLLPIRHFPLNTSIYLPFTHASILPSTPPPHTHTLLTHPPPSGTHLPTNPTPHPPQILLHRSIHPSTRYPSIHPSTYASLNLPIHHLTMAQAFVCYNALCRLASVRPQHGPLGSLPG